MSNKNNYDFVIIGSGFGGSVSAMRLAEKGYSVAVLEMGKRYETGDFPKTNWNVRKYLWLPQLFFHGIQKLTFLKDILILGGVGVGGGSLVYANTLLEPPKEYYQEENVLKISSKWQEIMQPYYKKAKYMLGATKNIYLSEEDHFLKEIATEEGREHTWKSVDVGVFFGKSEKPVPDPYFNGDGPERVPCNYCGGCMIGCNVGAKNTLDKNYLYFAEKYGAKIIPERKVSDIKFENDTYQIKTIKSTSLNQRSGETFQAKGVIVSAGVLGTLKLLLSCKQKGSLKNISNHLGEDVRTNSESFTGTTTMDKTKDWSKGLAITSGYYPTDETHIEIVRYPKGSDAMSVLATLMVDGGSRIQRTLKLIKKAIFNPLDFYKATVTKDWAKRSIIFLVMQTIDTKVKITLNKLGNLTTKIEGKRPPTYIPEANTMAEKFSKRTNGISQGVLPEILFDISTTAHILGGSIIGTNESNGVINKNCEVFGYKNLYVVDGSIIPANLGVNPSLTITAMAEHSMDNIPYKKESDQTVFDTPFPELEKQKKSKRKLLIYGISVILFVCLFKRIFSKNS